ncbi:MAG: CBS domain-containing protein [Xenococcus sp. MO_188.B8]|nr:CBS domain-containing protein [Xenococcus sp. MO_188.B8]
MKKKESVSQIASTGLITIQLGQKLSEARKLMQVNQIHHVPVLQGQKLMGILSAVDLATLSLTSFGSDEQANDTMLDKQFSVEEVMSKNMVTVKPTDPIREAAEILAEGHFHSLPIVDKEGNLQGLVTSTDLIRYLLSQY